MKSALVKFGLGVLFFLFNYVSLFGFSVGIITDVDSTQSKIMSNQIIDQSEKLIGTKISKIIYPKHSVKDQYDKLVKNKSVDIIIYLGIEKLEKVFDQKPFLKPVFFPFTNKFLLELPDKNEVSKLNNFSYIEPNINIKDDIVAAIKLFGEGTHLIVLNSNFKNQFNAISEKLTRLASKYNSKVLLISAEGIEANLANKNLKSVLFGYNCMKKVDLSENLKKLLNKEVGTYCLFGSYNVEEGFVAGYDSKIYFNTIIRKTAFAIKDVFESKNLANTSTKFRTIAFPDLIINVKLARLLKLDLSFDDLFSAKLLAVNDGLKTVSLVDFLEAAQEGALEYLKDKEELVEANFSYKVAKSFLGPTLKTSLYQDWIDRDQSDVTKYPESKLVLNAGIKQIIYDNDIALNIESKKYLEQASSYNVQSSELDTLVNAANIYINVEKAFSILELSKKNLNISKQNYNIALLKKQIGSASKYDLLRFETEMIKDKSDLSDSLSYYRISLINLYKFINADTMQVFRTQPVKINSIIENQYNQKLFVSLSSPVHLEMFKHVINDIAINYSVDIKQLDTYVEMQDSAVNYARRKLFVPDVSLSGSVTDWIDTSGENKDTLLNSMDNYLMGVNLNFSYTLFDTNRRRAKINKEKSKLIQVKIERQKQINNIIAKLDVVIEQIRKSYAQYSYQKDLVGLSEKNLMLVQDQYSLGRSSILEVIDAQETYFTAKTKYVIASYDLLKLMYEFNRYNGGFDIFYVNEKTKIDTKILDNLINSIDGEKINRGNK